MRWFPASLARHAAPLARPSLFFLVAAGLGLAGCNAPAGPPPVAATQSRVATAPASPATARGRPAPRPGSMAEPRSPADTTAPAAAAPHETPAAPPETTAAAEPVAAPAEPQTRLYRVTRDGVLGCADPAVLRLLRGTPRLAETQPQLAAKARQDGKCRTAFRASEWALLGVEDGIARLRLVRPEPSTPLTLHFLRTDIEE